MADFQLVEEPRIGILITCKQNGSAIGVPVWFDWDGEIIRCFAAKDSAKIKRLANNPKASLLVTNSVGEPESWLAFDGDVNISDVGGIELAEKLAQKYWDLGILSNAQKLQSWKEYPHAFSLLEMNPSHIRNGS